MDDLVGIWLAICLVGTAVFYFESLPFLIGIAAVYLGMCWLFEQGTK